MSVTSYLYSYFEALYPHSSRLLRSPTKHLEQLRIYVIQRQGSAFFCSRSAAPHRRVAGLCRSAANRVAKLTKFYLPRGKRTTATPEPSAAYRTAMECPMPESSAAIMVTLLARLSEPRALGASNAIERRSVVEMLWRIGCGCVETSGEYVGAMGEMLVAIFVPMVKSARDKRDRAASVCSAFCVSPSPEEARNLFR